MCVNRLCNRPPPKAAEATKQSWCGEIWNKIQLKSQSQKFSAPILIGVFMQLILSEPVSSPLLMQFTRSFATINNLRIPLISMPTRSLIKDNILNSLETAYHKDDAQLKIMSKHAQRSLPSAHLKPFRMDPIIGVASNTSYRTFSSEMSSSSCSAACQINESRYHALNYFLVFKRL